VEIISVGVTPARHEVMSVIQRFLQAPVERRRIDSRASARVTRDGILTSGPGFKARTVSLCSHSRADAVKRTHRSGTFIFCASLTQTARVSGSAFVLSTGIMISIHFMRGMVRGYEWVTNIHTNDYACSLLDECACRFDAFLALFQKVTQCAE
jgi:hypothetical protein